MPAVEIEGIRVAHFGSDNAEVAGGVKQARIPALPVREQFFNFVAKAHCRNVTERQRQDNDAVLVLKHPHADQTYDKQNCAQRDRLELRN